MKHSPNFKLFYTSTIFLALSFQSAFGCVTEFEDPPNVILSEMVEDWPSKFRALTPSQQAIVYTFSGLRPYHIYDELDFMEPFLSHLAELSGQKTISYEDYPDHYDNALENLFYVHLRQMTKSLGLKSPINSIFQIKVHDLHHITFRYVPSSPNFSQLSKLNGSIIHEPNRAVVNSEHQWVMYKGKVGGFNRRHIPLIAEMLKKPDQVIPLRRVMQLLKVTKQNLNIEIFNLRKRFREVDPDFKNIENVHHTGYLWRTDPS